MKTMNKTLKKTLVIILSVAVVCAAVWGILTLVKNARRGDVNVYAVSDFAMTDYWGDSTSTSGTVTTDRLQKVYVSSTQTVTEVFVTEGQTVHKGDKLLSYDTTLSDLDLQRAQIALERAKQFQTDSQNDLDTLKKAKNKETLEAEKASLEAKIAAQIKKEEAAGTREPEDHSQPDLPRYNENDIAYAPGTKERPYYFLYDGAIPQIEMTALMTALHPYAEGANAPVVYALLVTWNKAAEEYEAFQPISLRWESVPASPTNVSSTQTRTLLQTSLLSIDLPLPKIEKQPVTSSKELRVLEKKLADVNLLLEGSYTYKELQEMIVAAEKAVKADDVTVKLAQLNLDKITAEVQDGAVYSELDGVVKVVRDATEAYNEGSAVVEVSGGGGYYVTGSVSEMDLQSVTLGQTVTIDSWMTGTNCEGEIVEISEYPTTSNTGWSSGNNNVSWYPMKIFVSEDANLQEGDWVDISYQASAGTQGSTWYLETMFIRTDNGKSYVMVRGEDGRLTQRFIQTGRDLWGSYTEIRGGLTLDDFVAFPYGKDVTAGAKTAESTPDQFYNYY